MDNKPLNPLDQLANCQPAPATRFHTSGRRELRTALLSRGITIHARPRTLDDKLRAGLGGEMIGTLPIRRKEPKRGGMTKKEWKRQRRAVRDAVAAGNNNVSASNNSDQVRTA